MTPIASKTYKTRKLFLLPLTLDVVLLLILILVSRYTGSALQESVILAVIFIPLLYIFLESVSRQTRIDPEGVVIKKFLRKKALSWGDITNVDLMVVRNKVYLLLTTTKGMQILSNAYANFTGLIDDVIGYVGDDKVEDGVRGIRERPVKRISDIVMTWIGAMILVGVIYFKLSQ